jgi:hypothetical protein
VQGGDGTGVKTENKNPGRFEDLCGDFIPGHDKYVSGNCGGFSDDIVASVISVSFDLLTNALWSFRWDWSAPIDILMWIAMLSSYATPSSRSRLATQP